MRSLF